MKEFGMALFGWLLFNYGMFSLSKNKADALNQKFDYKDYFSKIWDNWGFSLLTVPFLVWYMDDICSVLTKLTHYLPGVDSFQWPVWDINYLGAGPLAELLYFGFEWMINRKATLVKWVHKNEAIKIDLPTS